MSDEYDIYEIGKVWLPDEARGVVKLSAIADNMGFVSLHFDNEYELYLSKGSLVSLSGLLDQSIKSIENFDRLKVEIERSRKGKGNVLQFRRKDKKDID